ncbi:hypothetical protein B296_00008841 [Ensete ventricosum]|uniref:Uncharacterized protein n=1 Tax=Ensete ventricosum TaxID=4639 RepID=A0A427B6P7_ENSVE|nr:hypothetical protein B296_00008841 [Ensete ventricosum]
MIEKESRDRKMGLTIAIFVEQAEGLLELGDLLVGELLRHGSSTQQRSTSTEIEMERSLGGTKKRSISRWKEKRERPRALRALEFGGGFRFGLPRSPLPRRSSKGPTVSNGLRVTVVLYETNPILHTANGSSKTPLYITAQRIKPLSA